MSDIADWIRDLLPHGTFDLRVRHEPSGATVLKVTCRCGRALDWAGSLPGPLLFNWLVNHASMPPRRGFETVDEPFLQPDYIPALVVGVPGEPIALWRRKGGAT